MESAQKRQKSWFSGITNLVGGGRASTTDSPSTKPTTNGGDHPRPRPVLNNDQTPSRSRNVFTAPSPDEPESPPRRASPSLLAQRKILERPQPSNNRYAASTSRVTNFSASTVPRSFGSSMSSHRGAGFHFSPPVPATVYKASFPPDTPGRTYRASTAELSGRGMSKTASSDLFTMRIPEPDAKLTGEAIAKQVPQDPSRNGSIYASEFLAHLCPPEFNETQRNQFFCILDLRRLKYAADEIFQKKDWKLNILNFAKEYEKSRSLIMLRYGLFEFKSVKVSKDVLRGWKSANNIPDDEDEVLAAPTAPRIRVNGTEGILGKRKQEEDHTSTASSQGKRARPAEKAAAERAPLAETTTPALNSGGNKRKATVAAGDVEETPPAKVTKASTGSSATRTFFEKVANTPAKGKDAPAAAAPKANAQRAIVDDAPRTLKPKPNPFGSSSKPADGNLMRSVLDGGLKPSAAQTGGNIFGYLSDASSAKGSGNENADADGEDSDDSGDASENQDVSQSEPSVVASGGIATPQPDGPLFKRAKPAGPISGSSTSSDASEATSGKSLMDRISKDKNGAPIRMAQEPAAPVFGSQPSSERAKSPEKSTAPPPNQTWNPETPIKFGTKPAEGGSIFGTAGSKPASSLFPPSATPAVSTTPIGFKFGPASTQPSAPSSPPKSTTEPAAPAKINFGTAAGFGSAPAQAQPEQQTSSVPTFGKPAATESKPVEKIPAAASSNIFAPQATTPAPASVMQPQALSGTASKPDTTTVAQPASTSLFGGLAAQAKAPAAPPLISNTAKRGNMFGIGPTSVSAAAGEQTQAKSVFNAPSSQPSSAIFGKTSSTADAKNAAAPSLFGNNNASGATQESKPLFGPSTASSISEPPKSLFPSTAPSSVSASQFSNMFGATSAPAASPAFTFGNPPAAPAASFGGGLGTQPGAPQSTGPVVFGGGDTGSAGSSFTFSVGNPFTSGATGGSAFPTISFGNDSAPTAPSTSFQFNAGSGATTPAAGPTPTPSFFGGAQPATNGSTSGIFGGAPATGGTSSSFTFGGSTQPTDSASVFSQQKPAQGMFNLAPPMGGTSTGTNTPFTFGGASSLATTPASGTPEPGATQEPPDQNGQQADGDEAPQEQISLTDGGPGEEDETAVHEVRAKALKLVTAKEGSDSESTTSKDKKSPWTTFGVGKLRLLKHKTTGAVRLLLRTEPRGHVALNRLLLPNFNYKPEQGGKYVKITTANDKGDGLETWMMQVKTKEAAAALAEALEANKMANKK